MWSSAAAQEAGGQGSSGGEVAGGAVSRLPSASVRVRLVDMEEGEEVYEEGGWGLLLLTAAPVL